MRLKVFILSFIGFVTFFSCDKIEEPFPEDNTVIDTGLVWTDSGESKSNAGQRAVLMEEFTGHTCNNCPGAAKLIDDLVKSYDADGKRFIPIGIHATDVFAAPKELPGAPAGSYQTDHRTTEGEEYAGNQTFIVSSLPRGMVSRLVPSKSEGNWQKEADQIFDNPGTTVANIDIKNRYSDSANVFQTIISVNWLVAHSGDLNLQIQTIEDSVLDWQLDGSTHIENYVHRHMFRGSLNGSYGEPLPAAAAGETYTDTLTLDFDPKNIGINPDRFIIMAFIYKQSPEYEVMQVNEAHIKGGH